ncbi:MAG: DUF5034 domain-containing protein [Candidatus Azobacteroides sp.]|nr:DUF5034 domain-containing protein [Candidatus Azobacteroides sp.]
MKKKLTIFFLLLVPIANILFYSCRCDVEQHINYLYKDLILKNLDNSGEKAIESESLQFNKDAYGIRLLLLIEEETAVVRAKQINSIFVQSASATSVESCPYVYQAIDSIVSIQVFTINDFDNLHTANSEITEYFKVAQTYSSVEDYLTNASYTQVYRDNGWFTYYGPLEIDLMLMTVPTINNHHQFRVRMELSDGRVFEEQTTEIELL